MGRVVVPGVSDEIPADKTNEAREEQERIIDMNNQGYSDLIKSGVKVAFSMIKRSKMTEYPDGNVGGAMDALEMSSMP
jgi:hypothetical protein